MKSHGSAPQYSPNENGKRILPGRWYHTDVPSLFAVQNLTIEFPALRECIFTAR